MQVNQSFQLQQISFSFIFRTLLKHNELINGLQEIFNRQMQKNLREEEEEEEERLGRERKDLNEEEKRNER